MPCARRIFLGRGGWSIFDSVRVQVGRAPRDTDERHYVDMVDAKLSSQAVWEVLVGDRLLTGEFVEKHRRANVIPLAAGAENMAVPMNAAAEVVYNVASSHEQNKKGAKNQRPDLSQVVDGKGVETRAGEGVRIAHPLLVNFVRHWLYNSGIEVFCEFYALAILLGSSGNFEL